MPMKIWISRCQTCLDLSSYPGKSQFPLSELSIPGWIHLILKISHSLNCLDLRRYYCKSTFPIVRLVQTCVDALKIKGSCRQCAPRNCTSSQRAIERTGIHAKMLLEFGNRFRGQSKAQEYMPTYSWDLKIFKETYRNLRNPKQKAHEIWKSFQKIIEH